MGSLLLLLLSVAFGSGALCHDPQPQLAFPVHSSSTTSRTIQGRSGFAHTQILPSGPNYQHQHIQRIVTTEAHPQIIHAAAHYPVLHAAPAHFVTLQKASPVIYQPYLTYRKPTYETASPTIVTAIKQPAFVTYKQPITTTKIIGSHPHIATHSYVPPAPTGHAIVTSYFNIPGSGLGKTSDFSSFGDRGATSFDKLATQQTQGPSQVQFPSQTQDRMYGRQTPAGRLAPAYRPSGFPEDAFGSSRPQPSFSPAQNDVWSSGYRQSFPDTSSYTREPSDLALASSQEEARFRTDSGTKNTSAASDQQVKEAPTSRSQRPGGYGY